MISRFLLVITERVVADRLVKWWGLRLSRRSILSLTRLPAYRTFRLLVQLYNELYTGTRRHFCGCKSWQDRVLDGQTTNMMTMMTWWRWRHMTTTMTMTMTWWRWPSEQYVLVQTYYRESTAVAAERSRAQVTWPGRRIIKSCELLLDERRPWLVSGWTRLSTHSLVKLSLMRCRPACIYRVSSLPGYWSSVQ